MKARDIYEEAIQTVKTVRDFTQVFDAYAQFEELSLSKRMEQAAKNPNPTEEGQEIILHENTSFLKLLYALKR